jgi:hypothetical protein
MMIPIALKSAAIVMVLTLLLLFIYLSFLYCKINSHDSCLVSCNYS